MNNEKIAPKVFPNFPKQLKDGKIPFYISNILQSISETSDSKSLENRLIECLSYLKDDVKLKNIFFNFGWCDKNKNFSKEINYKELYEIIGNEYAMGSALQIGQKADVPYTNEFNFNDKSKNNLGFEAAEIEKNKLGMEAAYNKNFSVPANGDFEENLSVNVNKILDNNSMHIGLGAAEKIEQEIEKPSQAIKTDLYQQEKEKNTSTLKSEEIEKADSNIAENAKERIKSLNDAEMKSDSKANPRNIIKSATKSFKSLMFSNKKSLSIAGEEDFDEDSTSIKKPIATTLSSNSYPLDYSKIILLQNEQNKNPIINSISNFNNINFTNNNEENLKMQNIVINSHPNIIMNNNNNNLNNLNINVGSPNLNFNKYFNNNNNNNKPSNFFSESSNNNQNQNEIPKIITPKFNKLIPTPTNNPLNNLIQSANFASNNINNNILININNTGIPIETNPLPYNPNQNVNSYLKPNSPTMHFNPSVFTKSNFTKNASNFSCHASPGKGFSFNPSSAFNANPHFKGVMPLNSPHSVKSLDLNQSAVINNNSFTFPGNQNFHYFNNINNNNFNTNINKFNNNNNFYNSTDELNRKILMSNVGSINSNAVSGSQRPKIKSKNLSFYEEEEENENSEDYKNGRNEARNKFNNNNSIDLNSVTDQKNFKPIRNNTPSNNYNKKNNNFDNQIESNNHENYYLLNEKNHNDNENISKNYSLINYNNSLKMRNNKNLNSSKPIKDADNPENNDLINNLNNSKELQAALHSQLNPNVSVTFNETNVFNVVIDKRVFNAQTENFGLPILERLTNNTNRSNLLNPSEGRQKRSIQKNKRFFDEEHFHFDNSFRKIAIPKNSGNSGIIRNSINSTSITNPNNFSGNNGLSDYHDGNNCSSGRNNFIKRKRKKTNRLGDSDIKQDQAHDPKNNFYEFNFGDGKRKHKKRKNKENEDNDSSAPSRGEEEQETSNNDDIRYSNENKITSIPYPNKNSKLATKLKSNRIYQSSQNNFFQSSFENKLNYNTNNNNYFNNPNYGQSFFPQSLQENRAKLQMGRRRKKRGKNQKAQQCEAKKSRQSSQKRFFTSRNTSYGLKEISKNVLKIVRQCKSTTYKQISDMIVSDINADINGTKDEKNIRRRIYDSLNVMKAMDIFKKEKNLKNINFNNTRQNAFLLSLLEKEDSSGLTPPNGQPPLKGILLSNSVQPLKSSFFKENFDFGSNPGGSHLNNYFNCGDSNINNAFEVSKLNYNNTQKYMNGQQNISNSNNNEEDLKAERKSSEIKDSDLGVKKNQEDFNDLDNHNTAIRRDSSIKDFDDKLKIEPRSNPIGTYCKEINEKANVNYDSQREREKLEAKAKEIQLDQIKLTHQVASIANQNKNFLQRKLSSESNFRPTACNSNTNINNNININIFNNIFKSENQFFYNYLLRASNSNLPTGIDPSFNYLPYNMNPNSNLINSGFIPLNANNNNFPFNVFQNNTYFNNIKGNSFNHNTSENKEEACINNTNQECRTKKQMIERLKVLIADKKRVLNSKLLEINLIKYNSNLVRKLIYHNKKNFENVNEDDKIRFPFLCVEFPSYKKSEVNLAINEDKTKLHCNFEDEVNIYGDLDLVKKISKINSIGN